MTDRMLQFFRYEHLPAHLAEVSQPFCLLADHIVRTLPPNPERTVALRKLLEAKDCAVRSSLYQADAEQPYEAPAVEATRTVEDTNANAERHLERIRKAAMEQGQ